MYTSFTQDYRRNILALRHLINTEPISYEEFSDYVDRITARTAVVYVAVDAKDIVVGTAKALFENKMHNNIALIGHIEYVAAVLMQNSLTSV